MNVEDEFLAAATFISILAAIDPKAGRVLLMDGFLLLSFFTLDLKGLSHVLDHKPVGNAVLLLGLRVLIQNLLSTDLGPRSEC